MDSPPSNFIRVSQLFKFDSNNINFKELWPASIENESENEGHFVVDYIFYKLKRPSIHAFLKAYWDHPVN